MHERVNSAFWAGTISPFFTILSSLTLVQRKGMINSIDLINAAYLLAFVSLPKNYVKKPQMKTSSLWHRDILCESTGGNWKSITNLPFECAPLNIFQQFQRYDVNTGLNNTLHSCHRQSKLKLTQWPKFLAVD